MDAFVTTTSVIGVAGAVVSLACLPGALKELKEYSVCNDPTWERDLREFDEYQRDQNSRKQLARKKRAAFVQSLKEQIGIQTAPVRHFLDSITHRNHAPRR